MTTLLNVQNGTDSLSTTVATEFEGKQRRIALQNFGHTHIFVYSSFSNKIILRWGSPMTCNEKIWTWRRREYACFFGETWYTCVWEWQRERSNINIITEKKLQHSTCQYTQTTMNDLNMLLLLILQTFFSALIFSSFIRFALSLSLLLLLLIFVIHRCPLDVCPFLVWRKDKKKIANVQFCYPHYSEECSIRGSYAFSYSLRNCMSLLSLKIYITRMTLFLVTHTLSISLNRQWDTHY